MYFEEEDANRFATAINERLIRKGTADFIHEAKQRLTDDLGTITALANEIGLDSKKDICGELRYIKVDTLCENGALRHKITVGLVIDGHHSEEEGTTEADPDKINGLVSELAARALSRKHWLGQYDPPRPDEDLTKYEFDGEPGIIFEQRLATAGDFATRLLTELRASRVEDDKIRAVRDELANRFEVCSRFKHLPFLMGRPQVKLTVEGATNQRIIMFHGITHGDGFGTQRDLVAHTFDYDKGILLGRVSDDIETLWQRFGDLVATLWQVGALMKPAPSPQEKARAESFLLKQKSQGTEPAESVARAPTSGL